MFADDDDDQPRKPHKPRVAPHNDSSQVLNCIHPVRGIRDLMMRHGIRPPNHMAHNRTAVSRKSDENKQAKQAPHPPQPPRKPRPPPRPPGSKDYVAENIASAGRARRVSVQGAEETDWRAKPEYGRVPRYLLDRKMQLAVQYAQQQAAKHASSIPEGMRLMGDEERRAMLALLERNRAAVQADIQALPFVLETPSQLQRRDALHRRVAEIEEALSLFSRPQVLIKEE